jgi:hypothetical protein
MRRDCYAPYLRFWGSLYISESCCRFITVWVEGGNRGRDSSSMCISEGRVLSTGIALSVGFIMTNVNIRNNSHGKYCFLLHRYWPSGRCLVWRQLLEPAFCAQVLENKTFQLRLILETFLGLCFTYFAYNFVTALYTYTSNIAPSCNWFRMTKGTSSFGKRHNKTHTVSLPLLL